MALQNFVNLKSPGDTIGNRNTQNIQSAFQGVIDSVNGIGTVDWHLVTPAEFLNGWTNYDPTIYEPAAYGVDGTGAVWVVMVIKGGTVGQSAFILPNGMRRKHAINLLGCSNGGTAIIVMNASGAIVPTVGVNTDFSLLVSFRPNA